MPEPLPRPTRLRGLREFLAGFSWCSPGIVWFLLTSGLDYVLAAVRLRDLARGPRLVHCLDGNEVDDSFYHAAGHRIVFLDNCVANPPESEGFKRCPLVWLGADGAPGLCDA